MTSHAGQSKILLTVMHESVDQIKQLVANDRSGIRHSSASAPQLMDSQRRVVMVRFIVARILAAQPKLTPTPAVLPSGELRKVGSTAVCRITHPAQDGRNRRHPASARRPAAVTRTAPSLSPWRASRKQILQTWVVSRRSVQKRQQGLRLTAPSPETTSGPTRLAQPPGTHCRE